MRLALKSTELTYYRWGAWRRATGRGKWSKEIRLRKEPHFPFLYSPSKLHTCVKQSWKAWHSAAGFSNQLFKLPPFCDTLLVELWKENARSCRKVFLPEAWKFDSDGGKKKKKVEGLLLPLLCVFWFSDTVYQWHIWWIWMNPSNEIIMGSEDLEWGNEFGISKLTYFILFAHSDEIKTSALLLIFYSLSLFRACKRVGY